MMRPPPQITRPDRGEEVSIALARLADEINAVTAWMHEAVEQGGPQWHPSADQPGWSKDGRYKAYTIEQRRSAEQPG